MHYRSLLATAVALVLIGQAQAADNQAITEQIGNLNRIEASQNGSNLDLSVYQEGAENVVSTAQIGVGSTARLSQQGEGNYQRVYQYNGQDEYSGNHRAVVDQIGANNTAVVLQYDVANHSAEVLQEGDYNITTLRQSERVNSYVGQQSGTGNYTRVSQEGGADAKSTQSGTNNTLYLHQRAWPYGASTKVSQTGASNFADIYQTDGGRYPGGSLELTQDGLDNTANIVATGGWSVFEFTQTGSANRLTAEQSGRNTSFSGSSTGTGNQVDINQSGDFNSLAVAQSGNDNMIVANQGGWWGEGDIGVISQTGSANSASLTQNLTQEGAATSMANIMQNGTGNAATVVQGY